MTAKTVLDIRDLAKRYARGDRRVVALEGVSLRAEAGAFKTIRGPSGSGKTTLLLAAGGLLRPDDGSVRVNGQDLYALSPNKRSIFRGKNIGFVFQQFYLVPYLTVLDNVRMPGIALDGVDVASRARELLERFRLGSRLDHYPSELSTGERQRVALARALVADPAIVLADEPTGNLDVENERIILECLREYAANGGAVVMATHGLRSDVSDEVVALDNGRLAP